MTAWFRQIVSYTERDNMFCGGVEVAGITVTRGRDRTLSLDLRQLGRTLVLEMTDRAEHPDEASTTTLVVADSLEALEEALTRDRDPGPPERKLLDRARRVLA